MTFLQKIVVVWQNISLVQRALLIAILLTVVVVGGFLVQWVSRPDMAVLYSNLDVEEAGKIIEKVGDSGIVYELTNGGTTIYVPRDTVSQLRLEMAKEGLPESGQKGYSIFDDEKIGISPFVQSVNLKRALQDELAKSIQMIDGIAYVRILIVSPEKTLFSSNAAKTSASVVLRLRAGYRLSALNIAAITHMVASSVEGLKSDKVTVVNSEGSLLSGGSDSVLDSGAGTVADYRERVERGLSQKVEDMLTMVLGPGRATVEVSAEIDMSSVNTVKKSYIGKGVTVNEEIKEKSKADGESSEGKKGGKEIDNTITTQKLFDETMETKSELPGEILSLTVAAFVDLSPIEVPKVESEDGDEEDADATPEASEPIMTITQVEEIIRNALGLKETDSLTVVDVKFNRPIDALLAGGEEGGLDIVAIAGQTSLGIMAICALLVLKMFSGAKKKADGGSPEQLAAGDAAAALLAEGEEGGGTLVLRRQIADNLRSNPEQVKQLFSSWLDEKGS